MHPLHFLKIIRDTLELMGSPYNSESAVNLLALTAAQESQLYEFAWQHRRGQPQGPALGPYQFEPATHNDLWDWIERGGGTKSHWIRFMAGVDVDTSLAVAKAAGLRRLPGDLYYATAICRLNYWRKPGALPAADNIKGLAAYWHRWHCAGCKGQPADAIRNYRRYVLRQKEES